MLKPYKKTIFLTTIVTALPMLLGVLLWDRLPDSIATHFDFNGVADGWSSKPFAVFALPGLLVGVHLLCTLGTLADPKHRNIQGKIFTMVLWVCPLISLITCGAVYLYALGIPVDMSLLCGLLCGVMFLIVGNYLPKCRQNYTVGIKLPWTLADEENWDRTHRLAGKLWMVGGLLMFTMPFWGKAGIWIFIISIFVMVLIPTFYSYYLYSKRQKS